MKPVSRSYVIVRFVAVIARISIALNVVISVMRGKRSTVFLTSLRFGDLAFFVSPSAPLRDLAAAAGAGGSSSISTSTVLYLRMSSLR